MLVYLKNNLGTIVITLILIIIVYLIIKNMIKDKKQGKSSCGLNCSRCAFAADCHKIKRT